MKMASECIAKGEIMALGLINLNNKNDLEKLSKEELINLIIDRSNELKDLMDNIINYSEEELVEYQKELKAIREMASIFCLCTGGN
jgi:hypothetical protein